jgi:hypothetical protein
MFSSAVFAKQEALPKRIQANYEVTKNGQPFAQVQEQYVVTGNSYKIESTTKGLGVYALFGVRTLTSTGKLTKQGLKPDHFELHQGENPKKALFADFDWPNKTLHMLVKGNTQDAVLSPGTQDLGSFAYQFMFLPRPLKNTVSVTLTTGKKLNQYQYQIKPGQELLKVAGAQYKTVHLIPTNQSKDQIETRELWLASDYNYLLVRFLMVDEDGARLEQTLTELHVD